MDAHTHHISSQPSAYILSPEEILKRSTNAPWYCAGVHPWRVADAASLWDAVREMAQRPECVAIGETGLDRIYPLWGEQEESLKRHWKLAHELQKPIILHIVRSSSDLLGFLKHHRPQIPGLWHGFTGPVEAIPKLCKFWPDLYFSFGPKVFRQKHFSELWDSVSKHRRLLETDDTGEDIQKLYELVGPEKNQILENFKTLFPKIR